MDRILWRRSGNAFPRMLFACIAVLAVVAQALLVVPAAYAEIDKAVKISNLTLVASTRNDGDRPDEILEVGKNVANLKFDYDASGARLREGDQFSIGFNTEHFRGLDPGKSIDVSSSDGEVLGTCSVKLEELLCTFNQHAQSLKDKGKTGFHGKGFVKLEVLKEYEGASLSFTVNGDNVDVSVPFGKILGQKTQYNAYKFHKVATPINGASKNVNWVINFGGTHIQNELQKSGRDVTFDGQTDHSFTIVDRLGSGQEFDPNLAAWKLLFTADKNSVEQVLLTNGDNSKQSDALGRFTMAVDIQGQEAKVTVTGPFKTDTNYRLVPATRFKDGVKKGYHYKNAAVVEGTNVSSEAQAIYNDLARVDIAYGPGYGAFHLRKEVAGENGDQINPDTVFPVNGVYKLPTGTTARDFPGWKQVGELNADQTGGTFTIDTRIGTVVPGVILPIDSTVTLSEDPTKSKPENQLAWESPTFSSTQNGEFVIRNGEQPEIVVKNTVKSAPRGKFSIAKRVEADIALPPTVREKTFTFEYKCGEAEPRRLRVKGNEEAVTVTEDIPAGTVCQVKELDLDVDIPGFAPRELAKEQSVTIEAAKTTPLVFTNSYVEARGTFSIAKKVVGNDAALNQRFEFTYTCVTPGEQEPKTGKLTASHGVDSDFSAHFPAGTSCTISETPVPAPEGYQVSTSIEPSTLVIEHRRNLKFTVTNTYAKTPGTFSITKEVLGVDTFQKEDFTFEYKCSDNATGTLRVKGDGVEKATSAPISDGATCEIRELNAQRDGYTVTTEISQPTVTIAGSKDIAVKAKNTYVQDLGTFTVAKKTAGGFESDSFAIEYRCGDKTGELSVPANGAPVQGPSFPVGTKCEISESEVEAKRPGYSVATVIDAPTFTIAKGVAQAVVVTNTYTALSGSFQISKNVSGNAAALAPKTFEFEYTCTPDAAGGETIVRKVSVDAGGTATISDIPAGSCQIKELPQSPIDNVEISTKLEVDGVAAPNGIATVTIDGAEPATPVAVAATNTYSTTFGKLAVRKTLSGDITEDMKQRMFTFLYTCTDPLNPAAEKPAAQPIQVPGDGAAVEVDREFAAGAVCDVTELVQSAKFDGYTHIPPVGQSVTIVGGGTQEVALNNAYTRDAGSLAVVKKVAGIIEQDAIPATFAFTYECSDGVNGTVDVPGDGKPVIARGSVLTGTQCVVRENIDAAIVPGYELQPPMPVNVLVESNGEAAIAELVNTYHKSDAPQPGPTPEPPTRGGSLAPWLILGGLFGSLGSSGSAGSSSSHSGSVQPSNTQQASPNAQPKSEQHAQSNANTQSKKTLAETGASVFGIALIAIVAILGGLLLLRRGRKQ
ncbi:DUF5979 domain-containing protein [Corynebacterium freiburgense]|uniref:DUF5979 domain-containing protein n=2 Tax=Corynebacterium freiburgense TaxID=556548 RepID=UPI000425887D|nr:DUF5979 domain-containing protein [Corynebacterium freiburgense]WJZ01443.1 T surface-antigen of pili [Corynebacterium freiburgense]